MASFTVDVRVIGSSPITEDGPASGSLEGAAWFKFSKTEVDQTEHF